MVTGDGGDVPCSLAVCSIPSLWKPARCPKNVNDTIFKWAVIIQILGQRVINDASTD